MTTTPDVSVIVPHVTGRVVERCLERLYAAPPRCSFEVIVVDDAPVSDGSAQAAAALHPGVRVLRGPARGFGAACNVGLRAARGRYFVLLNNDVEVTSGWLEPLVAAADGDPRIGFCQSKIRSYRHPKRFDAGGAAGGLLDVLGYPFALGSVLHQNEIDLGQYDTSRDIFWSHGAAMLVRRETVDQVGLFDEDFEMQMEEIDLCWRGHVRGWRAVSVPDSLVYHHGGFTLRKRAWRRQYYSHRNSIVLILKNQALGTLAWTLPCRLLLECAVAFTGLFMPRRWKQSAGIAAAFLWIATHPLAIARRRRDAQRLRRVDDRVILGRLYRGSVVLAYFVLGRRTADRLVEAPSAPAGRP